MDKELTPKQQTSEAIRQAEAILVMTGQHPNIDQVASTVALSAILRKFGKKVTTVISDDVPAGAKFLPLNYVERTLGGLRDFILQVDLSRAEVDKLKYTIENGKLNIHVTPFSGGFQQRDVGFAYGEYHFDLIIVVGVASYSRIDKVYAQNQELLRKIPLVTIDFHRINEQYGAINLIEPTAASLAEMLIALSESLQAGLIDEEIATTMLTGIMAATDRFTANHTTSKTMTIAAQMMAMGADQQKVVRNLYRDRTDRASDKKGSGKKEADKEKSAASPRPIQPAAPSPVMTIPQEPIVPAQPAPVQSEPQSQPQPVPSEPAAPIAQVQPEPAPVDTEPPAPNAPVVETPSPVAPAPLPVPEPEPQQAAENQQLEPETVMEELLPPQHIELVSPEKPAQQPPMEADSQPEPLINDTSDRKPQPRPQIQQSKPSNPTNNPIFAQRLDEFEL